MTLELNFNYAKRTQLQNGRNERKPIHYKYLQEEHRVLA